MSAFTGPGLDVASVLLPAAYGEHQPGQARSKLRVAARTYASSASFSAVTHHGAGRHAVWCKATHATQDLLIARSPDLYFKPPYVGIAGWVGIYLDAATDWTEVADRLRHAHELAAPPRARSAKGRPPARTRRPATRKTTE